MRELRPEQPVEAKPRPQPSGTDMPRGGRAATDKRQGVERSTASREALARQVDLPRTDERARVEFQVMSITSAPLRCRSSRPSARSASSTRATFPAISSGGMVILKSCDGKAW